VGRKTKYRRSTPVIRLHRNVDKAHKILSLVRDRLSAWGSARDPNPEVVLGVELVSSAVSLVENLSESVGGLELMGYAPPARPKSTDYGVGDKVKVAQQYRPRYEVAYRAQLSSDPRLLDELVVSEKLPTGELAVRRTSRSHPIIVRKSHVSRCR